MYRGLITLIAFITLSWALNARAQHGSVSFKVLDPVGKPLQGAHVIINGYEAGKTSRNGSSLIKNMLPGKYDIIITKKFYDDVVFRNYPVRFGAETTLVATIKRSKIEVDEEGNIVTVPGQSYKGYPAWRSPYERYARDERNRKCLPIEDAIGMDFLSCYNVLIENDTAYVSVIASAENRSNETKTLCGSFSFFTRYRPGVIGLGGHVRIPRLNDVGKFQDNPTFACQPKRIGAGEAYCDTLRFKYCYSIFEKWYGDISVWLVYFYGETGAWEDVRHVDIGTLFIPIGKPSN